jgi:hypothetical protein
LNAQQFLSAQLSEVKVRSAEQTALRAALTARGESRDCVKHVCAKLDAVFDGVAILSAATEMEAGIDTPREAAMRVEAVLRPVIDHLVAALIQSFLGNWHAEHDDE